MTIFEKEKALMPAVETLLDAIHASGLMGQGSPSLNKASDALLEWVGAVSRQEKEAPQEELGL